jgi:hypothetical protein
MFLVKNHANYYIISQQESLTFIHKVDRLTMDTFPISISNSHKKTNKRAKTALDRSPDPSNSSEQLPRQAF